MKHLKVAMATGLVVMSSPALVHAQAGPEFTGAITLGYNTASIGGLPVDVDLSGMSIDLETDIIFTNEFGIGLDFGFASSTVSAQGLGGDVDVDLMTMAIEPAYAIGGGSYIGAYYRMGDLDAALAPLPISFGIDSESYGFFAGHRTGQFKVEGWLGMSDSEPGLPGDIDIWDYGVAGSYDVTSEFTAFGSIIRTNIDAAGTDLNLSAYSIGGDYDFGNGFEAFGSVGTLDIDLGPLGDFDATGMTLGGSYAMDANGTPIILSAEYSYTATDLGPAVPFDPDINRFSVGLTIPLGGTSEPLNSNTRTARGDYRSAVAALVQSF